MTTSRGYAQPVASPAAPATRVTGSVVDTSGAPIAGASVTADASGTTVAQTTTGADGRFAVDVTAAEAVVIRAEAALFTPAVETLDGASSGELLLVLRPATLVDAVTVRADQMTTGLETPAGTSVLSAAELLTWAAGALDDALRTTPGFGLFRRTSSRVANPTTQGVTMRGVSASGASRSIVLADGLPLNDVFGSWVYWNRVPLVAIDRIDVQRGTSGDLYGPDALGGVVDVVTLTPSRTRLRAALDFASHDTVRGSAFAGTTIDGWTMSAAGEAITTDGVPVVAADERGLVDVPAWSEYQTGFASVGYQRSAWHVAARANLSNEDRGNGTPVQVNDTWWRQYSGEAAGSVGGGVWQATAGGGKQRYFQTFSTVAVDRASERLSSDQHIPATFALGSGQWTRQWGDQSIVAGADFRRAEFTQDEVRYSTVTGAPTGETITTGSERLGSLFGRFRTELGSRVTLVAGARGDFWSADSAVAGEAQHDAQFFSPRLSAAWRIDDAFSVRGAVARAYRTPTLNERYRGFRQGSVVTNANPLLEPERLTSVEAGVLWARTRASARVIGYWSQLDDAIANVTVSVTPTLITRERQNTDTVRAKGIEAEGDLRLGSSWQVSGLAVWSASRFHDTPEQPALQGNRLPQTPEYQFGAGVTYADPRILTFTTQLRIVGVQFDDDLNLLPLGRFAVLDFSASRSLTRGLQAVFSVENLFDEEYATGRSPVTTIGWPRTVWAGLRGSCLGRRHSPSLRLSTKPPHDGQALKYADERHRVAARLGSLDPVAGHARPHRRVGCDRCA